MPPEVVGIDLADHHGSLFTAVSAQISLTVTVEVQPARHDRAVHRFLPDAGVDDPAVPQATPRRRPTLTDKSIARSVRMPAGAAGVGPLPLDIR